MPSTPEGADEIDSKDSEGWATKARSVVRSTAPALPVARRRPPPLPGVLARMDAGHASHVAPSFTCTLCQQEAYDAWKVRKAAWDAECTAWTPYKPAGKHELLISILGFPFLLVGGVILFVGFYSPGILLAFRPLTVIGLGWIDLSSAVQWLLISGLCVSVITLVVGDGRENPRPVYPVMGPLAAHAYYREHPASRRPDPRVEPLGRTPRPHQRDVAPQRTTRCAAHHPAVSQPPTSANRTRTGRHRRLEHARTAATRGG